MKTGLCNGFGGHGDAALVLAAPVPAPVLALADEIEPARNPVLVYLAGLASSSRRTQAGAVQVVADFLAGKGTDPRAVPWHEVRFEHAAALRSSLAERYAPATGNRILSTLRAVLRTAWRLRTMTAEDFHRAIDIEPIRGSRLPAGRSLGRGELRALFEHCGDSPRGRRDGALLAVGYGAGLRRSEIVALDLEDVDLARGGVRVRDGKGRKERQCWLASGAVDVIERWLAVRGRDEGAFLHPVRKGGRVLRRRLAPQSVLDALKALAKTAGLATFSPHDLRRTWVGDLLAAGADLSSVQRLAGHSSSATTCRYDRRPDSERREASRLIHIPVVGP